MARDHVTQHGSPNEYTFALPELDISSDYRLQPRGRFSRLSGVDGRYPGKLRHAPGYRKRVTIPSTTAQSSRTWQMATLGGIEFQKSFAIAQAPRSSTVVRGILFMGQSTSGASSGKDVLYALYFADNDADGVVEGPFIDEVAVFDGTVTEIDIAHDEHLVYIVGLENVAGVLKGIEKIARFSGGHGIPQLAWIAVDWKTSTKGINTPTFFSSVTLTPKRDYLVNKHEYGIAMRIRFPEQGLVGPVIGPFTVAVDAATTEPESHLSVNVLLFWFAATASAETPVTRAVIETYRTINPVSANLSSQRGILFRESQYEIRRSTGSIGFWGISSNGATSAVTTPGNLANVAIGDVIYLTYKFTAGSGADEHIHYRRIVTGVNDAAGTINWDQDVPLGVTLDEGVVAHDRDEIRTWGLFTSLKTKLTFGRALADAHVVADTPQGLSDDSLVHAPQLQPEDFLFFKGGNPAARLMAEYEGLLVRSTVAVDDTAERDVLRWDFIEPPRRGLVNVLNRRPLPLDDKMLALKNTDTFLVAIMRNRLLRMYRSGSRLSVDTIHNHHGATGRWANVAVGNNLYLVSPVGILVVELTSGQVDVFNATQHFFSETGRWRNDLESIHAAYDGELGALMFLNTVNHEMIVVWLNHGVLGHFVDVPFDWLLDGLELSAGERRRALFIISGPGGGVYEFDAAYASDTRTTCDTGTGATYNGLAGAGTNATTLVPPGGGSFDAGMTGHFIQFFNPTTGARTARVKVTGLSGSDLTYASASPAPAPGDRFAIGAIPMRATMWPLSGATDVQLVDLFRDKGVYGMSSVIVNMSGDTGAGNPNKKIRYQLFERVQDAPTLEGETTMVDTDTFSNNVNLEMKGTIIVPGFEVSSSDLDFDILGVIVEGEIGGGKRDKT